MLRLLAAALTLTLAGCSLATRAGVALLYEKADLPPAQVVRDLCYAAAAPCDTPKHTLDLYRPAAAGWPVIIFVHGGNWDSGDKNFRAGGADVYANIGRFYAARGIGVAVINYRLQPSVAWPAQVDDVRAALAWVRANIARYGGQSGRLFLMGHSAGAHLASLVALTAAGAGAGIRGVIAVSGAALDLTDEQTYQLGADRKYYRARFQGDDRTEEWQRRASPARFATATAPPFLILYATGETKALQRQSQVLHDSLTRSGASSRLVAVPGESHTRIVLALTHPDKLPAKATFDFVLRSAPAPGLHDAQPRGARRGGLAIVVGHEVEVDADRQGRREVDRIERTQLGRDLGRQVANISREIDEEETPQVFGRLGAPRAQAIERAPDLHVGQYGRQRIGLMFVQVVNQGLRLALGPP